jgi:hypothetical protein
MALALALIGAPRVARAFDDAGQFIARPEVPDSATFGASAEGLYFTGAPRYSGLDCASCHTDGPQQVSLRVGAAPDDVFALGYEPGQTYELQIDLANETEGIAWSTPSCTDPPTSDQAYAYEPCNHNGFVLEIDSAFGPLSGKDVFCAASPAMGCPLADPGDEVFVAPDGDAVFSNRPRSPSAPYVVLINDPTRWHLFWTAPPAGTGPLALYVAAVDGNGGSGTVDDDQDPYGDDTVRAVVSLQERGALGALNAAAGCSLGGAVSPSCPAAVVLWMIVCALVRRARR